MDAIFEAVMESERALARRLSQSPDLARSRAKADHLVESIPHWIYTGDTPLHLACAALRTNCAKLILQNGANVNAQNRRGATALHYTCDPRPGSGGVWDPAAQAALIEFLIANGADIDRADKGGATPLHRAVRARSPTAVRSLLENRARVDVRLGKLRSLPLHLAVQSTGAGGTAGTVAEQLEIIQLLLAHGAKAGDRDSRGRTPIDWSTNPIVTSALGRP